MAPSPSFPPASCWRPLLESALAEDLGSGDVTSASVLPEGLRVDAVVEARQELVICGLELVEAVFRTVGPELEFHTERIDGQIAGPKDPLARVRGDARKVLAAERTALNFLARLCGVATHTRRFVEEVAGTGARVVDTRKTLPGWRSLDKYAVAVGGGVNHRAGLFDAILIKDNHIAAAGDVTTAVKAARSTAPPHLWIEVEVESEEQAAAALEAGADALLLDNRSVPELEVLARRFRDQTLLEASGGVNLQSIRAIAETGVHRISIGALTHSAPGADVALEILPSGVRA